ncbi:MAG: VWA domain-containing protein, partial [Planctomycetaceae bacterium]|nr:VWA domain-containing protein [Planctomycetaceae bacterium]
RLLLEQLLLLLLRRRLLLEQLLLLLLRILIVLALLFLIARLIMDPRLTVFGGEGKTHHLVVLDDSASMNNRWGDTTAFEEAKKVILDLVREGAKRPQTQTFSLGLLSNPTKFEVPPVDVSQELLRDLQEKLENLKPSYQRPDLQAGLEAAGKHLLKETATIKHLHIFSDLREVDWQGKEALGDVLDGLEEDGIAVNLVQTIGQALPNVGITTLEGDLHSAAVGVPVRLRIGVTNFGDQVAENVSVTVVQDGDKLPLSVTFAKIEPGKEEVQNKDITFTTEGLHQVRVEVEEDAFSADNARFLSINIPKQNYVLIVTNDTLGDAAFAMQIALAPQLELTGIATNVIQPDFLEQELQERGSQFRAIYMLNIPEIDEKAMPLLESYVNGGGGLVWFMGDKVRPTEYNEMAGFTKEN